MCTTCVPAQRWVLGDQRVTRRLQSWCGAVNWGRRDEQRAVQWSQRPCQPSTRKCVVRTEPTTATTAKPRQSSDRQRQSLSVTPRHLSIGPAYLCPSATGDQRVCLFVCLFVCMSSHVSQNTTSKFHLNFLHVLCHVVSNISLGSVATPLLTPLWRFRGTPAYYSVKLTYYFVPGTDAKYCD